MAGWVYRFGGGEADGNAGMRALLGGKGANLAEMASIGLPVPPGFTITTALCNAYYAEGRTVPAGLDAEIEAGLAHIERIAGAGFGDADRTLLVSVRSGARASMPGMMDTVLNLGLNDETADGLARASGDARFAYDSYRRLIQMYGDVVLGVEHRAFEELLEQEKEARGYRLDTEMQAGDWYRLIDAYKALVREETGGDFPQDARAQLRGAIRAVLDSWMNARAVTYRRLHGIPAEWGTAVTVQAMVFGNMGDDCATGVAFTRNPSTGEAVLYGEYLINAQGEDVVAGTPHAERRERGRARGERHRRARHGARDAGRLRRAPGGDGPARTPLPRHAGRRVHGAGRHPLDPADARRQAHRQGGAEDRRRHGRRGPGERGGGADAGGPARARAAVAPRPSIPRRRAGCWRGACRHRRGAACGKVVFDPDEAEDRANRGEAVILLRTETSPEDIHGMHAARGIVTSRGGMTSHAAVVARGMGRPCITGASALRIDEAARECRAGEALIAAGDTVTIDGASGELLEGAVPTIEPALSDDFATLMGWADGARRLRVRTNAETPADAETALRFGAEGIGLCRTEHMFFDDARIVAVREMIVATDADGRRAALAKLLPAQRSDFAALFRIMAGLPVTIRLLDPPLHEFLPRSDAEIAGVAQAAGVTVEALRARIAQLHEINPMLGHRGCRLGISYPEIYEMQARAIFEGGGGSCGRAPGRARDHGSAGGDQARVRHPQGRHRARTRRGGRRRPAPGSPTPWVP